MEYAEVEFLLSEVNGWDDVHYRNGVRASLERWGVTASEANTFVSALPPASQANVLNQKYLALFMQPQEAYAEVRRTGFPSFLLKPGETNNLLIPTTAGATTYVFTPISPSGSTLTELPARITYPVTLLQYNPNGYNSGVANLGAGGDKLTTKLIWDKN
ncbi:Susd and RagB outer membrane lipoprotein [compost metagenome]